jgi:hypothetical protein
MYAMDGLMMVGASPLGGGWNGFHIGHAVRVFAGAVRSTTILNSQHTGGLAVVDAFGVPFGSYVSKSAGGYVFLGEKGAGGMDAALLPSEVRVVLRQYDQLAGVVTRAALCSLGVADAGSAGD